MSWWRRRPSLPVLIVEAEYVRAERRAATLRLAALIASWPTPLEVFERTLAGDPDPYGGPVTGPVTSTGAPLETAGEILQVVAVGPPAVRFRDSVVAELTVSRGYGSTRPELIPRGHVMKKVKGDAIWRIVLRRDLAPTETRLLLERADAAAVDVGDLLYV